MPTASSTNLIQSKDLKTQFDSDRTRLTSLETKTNYTNTFAGVLYNEDNVLKTSPNLLYDNAQSRLVTANFYTSFALIDEFYMSGELIRTKPLTNRVGILNGNPAYTLDIGGDCNVSGNFRINGNILSIPSSIKQYYILGYLNANQSIPGSTTTTLNFITYEHNFPSAPSLSSGVYTPSLAGTYTITFNFTSASSAGTLRRAFIRWSKFSSVAYSLIQVTSSIAPRVACSCSFYVSSSDITAGYTFEGIVYQDNAAAITANGGASYNNNNICYLNITYIG